MIYLRHRGSHPLSKIQPGITPPTPMTSPCSAEIRESGIVTVSGSISVGGFQFDNTGYQIQGGTITLSSPGATPPPIIDTGANNVFGSAATPTATRAGGSASK